MTNKIKITIANAMIRNTMQIYDIAHSLTLPSTHTKTNNDLMTNNIQIDMIHITWSEKNITLSSEFQYKKFQLFRQYIISCLNHYGFKKNKIQNIYSQPNDITTKEISTSEQIQKLGETEILQTVRISKGESVQLITKINNSIIHLAHFIPRIYSSIRLYYEMNRIITGSELRLKTLIHRGGKRIPKSVLILIMEYAGPA